MVRILLACINYIEIRVYLHALERGETYEQTNQIHKLISTSLENVKNASKLL